MQFRLLQNDTWPKALLLVVLGFFLPAQGFCQEPLRTSQGLFIPTGSLGTLLPEDCEVARVGSPSPAPQYPLLGKWTNTDSGVWFHPTGRLLPEATYVLYHAGQAAWKFPPIGTTARTAKVTIYPQVEEVPQNLLKITLVFSEPMREGVAFEHLHWEDAQGNPLPLPFLDLSPELWNRSNTQLTLWLDPGRIKRGLAPNETQGVPLAEGVEYVLNVSDTWPTRRSSRLAQGAYIRWKVGAPDREKPTPEDWSVEVPKGPEASLAIDFHEPMAYAVLQDVVLVRRHDGGDWLSVPGTFHISPDNRQISFLPSEPWAPGTYEVLVYPRLEDLSGNNLYKLFDVDLDSEEEEEAAPWLTTFVVKE